MIEGTILEQGGPLVWPLVLVSLFGFLIFLERALYLHRGQIRTNDFLAGIKNLLRGERLVEALTLCEETPGPVPGVVKACLLHAEDGEQAMRGAVEAAALIEIPALERRIGSLAAVGRLGPSLGILGTIIGMLESFQALQAAGAYAHFGEMAGGFHRALLLSAIGLTIGVLAQVAHHFLWGRVRALVHDMEFAGHDLIQFVARDLPRATRPEPAESEDA